MYKKMFVIAALTLLPQLAFAEKAKDKGEAEVKGSMDKDVIRRVIRQHIGEVKRCYEAELVKNPHLAGKVMVRFTIGTDGKVTESAIQETTLGNAAAEKCISDALLKWEFPKPQGGKVVVSYPFMFASTESPDSAGSAK